MTKTAVALSRSKQKLLRSIGKAVAAFQDETGSGIVDMRLVLTTTKETGGPVLMEVQDVELTIQPPKSLPFGELKL